MQRVHYVISTESVSHLFIDCSFGQSIWNRISNRLNVSQSRGSTVAEDMLAFVGSCPSSLQGGQDSSSIMLPGFDRHIWHERNLRIFKKERTPSEKVMQHLLEQIKSRIHFLNIEVSSNYAAAWGLVSRTYAKYANALWTAENSQSLKDPKNSP